MSIRRCIELVFLLSSVGCTTFQDCEYRWAQSCRAHHAWWCGCDAPCSSNPWSHYSRGWRSGYSDVLMGGDGSCPPVPPTCYWSHKYQSDAGEAKIENWYMGYQHGACAAQASFRDRFHYVPMSDTFRQCSPGCLPNDFAPYPHGMTPLGTGYSARNSTVESEESTSGKPTDGALTEPVDDAPSPTPQTSPNGGASSLQQDVPPPPLQSGSKSPGKTPRGASRNFLMTYFDKN